MKKFILSPLLTAFAMMACVTLYGQSELRRTVLIDIAHGQRFWNDPEQMSDKDNAMVQRVTYMTEQIKETASSVNAKIGYIRSEITPKTLDKCNILFIHLPSAQYKPAEVKAIKAYVEKGGALFLVMDEDYWATLEQTNVNDIVSPYGITFGQNNTDTIPGGHTRVSPITDKELKVTYHGARKVSGGTPFCFSNQSGEVFGTFTEVKNRGRIVAMGDGMVSLYMTRWKDVDDYQCSAFMHEVFAWLTK